MNEQNIKLNIIAYYLSKFDLDAVKSLGYQSRMAAINDISLKLGNHNNYLKLRRDEFDVLTGSHRRGYATRDPARGVLESHNHLKDINFDDFTNIVYQLIHNKIPEDISYNVDDTIDVKANYTDEEIEAIINAKDTTSKILIRQTSQKTRIYDQSIIENLKKLYQYRCQICGYSAQEYGVHIVEAHHILSFSQARNNDSDNIIIVCPNHHRLIHCAKLVFDRDRKVFVFSDGNEVPITINLHL